jgi:hypothetical protein
MRLQNKPKAFYFHYNKPASRAAGKNILTIHHNKQCVLVEDIDCQVPVKTRSRKSQPHCVICGRGIVNVVNGVAVITGR